jgi:hypothetical protein
MPQSYAIAPFIKKNTILSASRVSIFGKSSGGETVRRTILASYCL